MTGHTEGLIEESQKLRDELLRTAARLELFASELAAEVLRLRYRIDSTITSPGELDDDASG
jgi:hypothetical protein